MTEMVFPTYIFWCAVFGGVAGMIGGLLVVLFFKICEAKAQREDREDNEKFLRKRGSIEKDFEIAAEIATETRRKVFFKM